MSSPVTDLSIEAEALGLVEETKISRNSDRMATRARNLRRKADSIWKHKQVRDPRAGLRTVEVASALHDEIQKTIDKEISKGFDNHTRLSAFARIFSTVAIFIDFFILLFFMTSVFNVDYAHPWGMMSLISMVFAILATGISYAIFTSAGYRLRNLKTNRNTLTFKEIDKFTWGVLTATFVMVSVITTLMYYRVNSEVLDQSGDATQAMVYGYLFSAMVFCLGLVVVYVHAFDGSILTERADGLAKAIKRPMKQRQKYMDQAQELDHLITEQQEIANRQEFQG